MLLGYKPVQHVTVLNTVGNCNTMVLLYYILLHYITLHYIVLYCTVLYCIEIVLYCIILYYIILYYIILYCRQPQTHVKPEAAITVFELLMMSGVSLETC